MGSDPIGIRGEIAVGVVRCPAAVRGLYSRALSKRELVAMPIYEYKCEACDEQFERLSKSMSPPRPSQCPSCGSGSVVRVLSVFAARSGESRSAPVPVPGGGCGRCGDPNGPCSLN